MNIFWLPVDKLYFKVINRIRTSIFERSCLYIPTCRLATSRLATCSWHLHQDQTAHVNLGTWPIKLPLMIHTIPAVEKQLGKLEKPELKRKLKMTLMMKLRMMKLRMKLRMELQMRKNASTPIAQKDSSSMVLRLCHGLQQR